MIDVDAVQLSQQLQTHLTELGRSPPSEPINPFGTQLRSPSQNVMMPVSIIKLNLSTLIQILNTVG